MRFTTPLIAWQSTTPVFSLDFHPSGRLATCGADNIVNVWRVEKDATVTFLSTLVKHSRAVNVVRFSPDGQYLASAGDDGLIYIWKQGPPRQTTVVGLGENPVDRIEEVESWTVTSTLSRVGGKDIYALEWSADSTQLVSGTFDGTMYLWHLQRQQGPRSHEIKDHFTIVQGVCYDPLNSMIVTSSSDRSVRIYKKSKKGRSMYCAHHLRSRVTDQLMPSTKSSKKSSDASAMDVDISPSNDTEENARNRYFQHKYFLDDSVPTFFRRPTWSPEGSLLLLPCGQFFASSDQSTPINATWVFTRNNCVTPSCYIPSKNPSVVVKFSPCLYKSGVATNSSTSNSASMNGIEESRNSMRKLFELDYKLIFAIATLDAVFIYDSEHLHPIAAFQEGHYDRMTDLSWSHDGTILAISNSDGYVTLITFEKGELGDPLDADHYQRIMKPAFDARIPAPVEPKKPKQPTPTVADTSETSTGQTSTASTSLTTDLPASSSMNSITPLDDNHRPDGADEEDDEEDDDSDIENSDAVVKGSIINFDEAQAGHENPSVPPSPMAKKTGRRVVTTLVTNAEDSNQPQPVPSTHQTQDTATNN